MPAPTSRSLQFPYRPRRCSSSRSCRSCRSFPPRAFGARHGSILPGPPGLRAGTVAGPTPHAGQRNCSRPISAVLLRGRTSRRRSARRPAAAGALVDTSTTRSNPVCQRNENFDGRTLVSVSVRRFGPPRHYPKQCPRPRHPGRGSGAASLDDLRTDAASAAPITAAVSARGGVSGSSSAASNGSSSSATWPPATPSGSPTTGPRSSLPRSCCGCVPTYRTRPNTDAGVDVVHDEVHQLGVSSDLLVRAAGVPAVSCVCARSPPL